MYQLTRRKNVFIRIRYRAILGKFALYQKIRKYPEVNQALDDLGIPRFLKYQILNKRKFYFSFLFSRKNIRVHQDKGFEIPAIGYRDFKFKVPYDYYISSVSWERTMLVIHLKIKSKSGYCRKVSFINPNFEECVLKSEVK